MLNFNFQPEERALSCQGSPTVGNKSMRMSECHASRSTRRVAMARLDRLWELNGLANPKMVAD